MSMRLSAVIAASAAILPGAGSALAQLTWMFVDTEAGTAGPGRSNAIIGLGVGLAKDYEGSDYYKVGVVPFGRFSYKEYQQYLQFGPNFGSRTYQARLNAMPYEGFELGPMLAYRPGRKHVENRDVDRLPNIDNGAEAGGFTRYWLPLGLPGRQAVGLDLSGAADVSNAYNGWWIQPGLDYKAGVSETVGFSARVFADYASANYMDEFFGISSGQSARSGLRQYNADAGWKDVGLALGVNWQFASNWFTGAVATYERLVGDAADSPVVRSRTLRGDGGVAGSKNQAAGGLYVGYKF
jgi:outer membrane protein